MAALPSGTVTLLFSDIEGSTQVLSRLGDAYADALDAQRQVLRRAWAAHGGTELGTEGDSFYVVFTTAEAAVAAATAAQLDLDMYPWPQGERVRVRIGIHTGSPQVHDGAYVGMDVHRAARIAAAAHGGQVIVSSSTAELVAGALPAGVSLQDFGLHQLKDIAHPERLFQLCVQGLQSDFPPLKTLGAVSNLPVPATALVGRDGELAELTALLSTADTRLVTLTGPGGSGKTRLAIAVAQAMGHSFLDGVFFVPLAAVTAAEEMWTSIAEVIGIPPEARSPSQRQAHIGRRSLIILDNLEQLPAAAEVVRDLLTVATSVAVVTTSRRPLHLTGEHEHPVPPLQLPEHDNLEEAADAGGVQLFVQHARMVRPSFVLNPDNVEAVAAICRRLDGLPLAIEFAAARSKLLSPAALLARIDRISGLRSRDVARPDRQQTLHAAMAWSYDLLNDDLKSLFRQLGIFAGGADLDAVAAVCGDDLDPLAGIEELVDVSLATVSDGADGEPRVALLQTVRDFALGRLTDLGELDAVAARHTEHYTALVESIAPTLVTSQYLVSNERLEREHANILEALEWSLCPDASEPPPPERAEVGLRLCSQLPLFWSMRGGYDTEAQRWLERAISVNSEEGSPLAAAMCGLGELYAQHHNEEPARQLLNRSLEIYRRLHDPSGVCVVLRFLGDMDRDAGNHSQARSAYDEAVAIARSANIARRLGSALLGLSVLEQDLGNSDDAIELITEARDICWRIGDERGAVLSANNRACTLLEAGRTDEALTELAALVPSLRRLRNPWANYYVISTFADVYARLGDYERAVRLHGTSDAIGDWLGEAAEAPLSEQEQWSILSAEMRKVLKSEDWDAAYHTGRTSSVDDAITDLEQALTQTNTA